MRRHDSSRHRSRRLLSGLVFAVVVAGYAERRYRTSRPAHETPHAPLAFAPADEVVAPASIDEPEAERTVPAPVPAPELELGDEPVERRAPAPHAWDFVASVPEVSSFADAGPAGEAQVEVEGSEAWADEALAPVEVEATVEHDSVDDAPPADEAWDEVEAEVEIEVEAAFEPPVDEPTSANEHWFGSFAPETPWAPPVAESPEQAGSEPVAEEVEEPARPFGGTPVLFGSAAPLELEPPRSDEHEAEPAGEEPVYEAPAYGEVSEQHIEGEAGERPFRYPPAALRRWMGTNLS